MQPVDVRDVDLRQLLFIKLLKSMFLNLQMKYEFVWT